jgi:ABC-type transport system substrate-binding protein
MNPSIRTILAILMLVTLAACDMAGEVFTTAIVAPTQDEKPAPELEEPDDEPADQEHVLVIGHLETTVSYDLAHALIPTSRMVHRATYDTLVTFPDSDTSKILPSLATSWSVSDDGLTYNFDLRKT